MRPIFAIEDHIEAVLNATVDRETGEISEDGIAALDALEGEKREVMLATAAYAKGQRAEAAAIQAVADGLLDRARRHLAHASRLESYVEKSMEPGEKLSDARVALSWRKSTSVQIISEDALPDLYWRTKTTRTPDKTMIGEALKDGAEIPGATLLTVHRLQVK